MSIKDLFSTRYAEKIFVYGKDCQICNFIIFNLPLFIDIDLFDKFCKEYDIKSVTVFKEEPLRGIVLSSVSSFNMEKNIKEVKEKLSVVLIKTLEEMDYSIELKRDLKEGDFIENLANLIINLNEEYKQEKIGIEEIRNDFNIRYSQIFGERGVDLLVDMFLQKDKVLENYSELEDYLLKRLSLEYFVVKQLKHGTFLLSYLITNNKELLDLLYQKDCILIETINRTLLRQKIYLPGNININNCFLNSNPDLIIMFVNPVNNNYILLRGLLELMNANINYGFVNHTLSRQLEMMGNETELFKIDIEKYKIDALSYDLKKLDRHLGIIDSYSSTLYSYYTSFVYPLKQKINIASKRRFHISKNTISRLFDKQVTKDGIIEKATNLPQIIMEMLPDKIITETKFLIDSTDKSYLKMFEVIKQLKREIKEYRDTEKIKTQQEKQEKILFIFSLLNKLIDLIKIFKKN